MLSKVFKHVLRCYQMMFLSLLEIVCWSLSGTVICHSLFPLTVNSLCLNNVLIFAFRLHFFI